MRRTRRKTRRRRRRQRGGFLDALKSGLNKGLSVVGLGKKEEDDEIKRTHASADLSQPSSTDQVGGRKRRRRKSRRRKSRKSRRTRKRRCKRCKCKTCRCKSRRRRRR